ncbi:hypothetical protein GF351_05690 [Candidatus Woesearchaeota archaeon]|nr:hypothetical protein [Candidatus Woesearchaeota archaeon]
MKTGKKGIIKLSWETFFDLVLAVVILMAFLSFVGRYGENTDFEMNFLARDIALIIDTLHASPGNTVIDYPQDTLWFSFEIGDGKVIVYDRVKSLASRTFTYGANDDIHLEKVELSPEKKPEDERGFFERMNPFHRTELEESAKVRLRFVKIGDRIIVGRQEALEYELNELSCPDTDPGARAFNQKIFFHPISSTMEAGDMPIGQLNLELAEIFRQRNAAGIFREVDLSRETAESPGPEKLQEEAGKSDVFVMFSVAQENTDKSRLTAYYLRTDEELWNQRRRSLACKIAAAVSSETDVAQVSYLPLDRGRLDDEDRLTALGSADLGVYVELSNSPETARLLENVRQKTGLAQALFDGIEGYFEG